MNIAMDISFELRELYKNSVRETIASVVDLPFLKPNWWDEKTEFSIKKLFRRKKMAFSRILLINEVTAIGL